MDRAERRRRQRTVTEEPFALGEAVKGRPLSSIPRRTVALGIDGLIWLVVGTPLSLLIAFGALWLQSPELAQRVAGPFLGRAPASAQSGMVAMLEMVGQRRPSALPPDLVEPVLRGDEAAIRAALEESDFNVEIQLTGEPSYYDAGGNQLHLRNDVIFGRIGSGLGFAALGLVYFTLAAWLGRGRTPGKWVVGIRAIRLDGQPMRLWDAFSRAGGYTASFSTLGLGFLEALWDPNRQALHDRVASTVVVRDPRRTILTRMRDVLRSGRA